MDAAHRGFADAMQEEMWPAPGSIYVGSLVEIHGISRAARLEQIQGKDRSQADAAPMDINGQKGRVMGALPDGSYIVNTFEDYVVTVPGENLKSWEPLPPEDGGFDIIWPSMQDDFLEFTSNVAAVLANKGWCLIQMNMGEDMCTAAAQQARQLVGFNAPRQEFVVDFMGHSGSGKSVVFDRERSDAEVSNSLDALSQCSSELTNLMLNLRELTSDSMGFNCYSRSKSYVWLPYSNLAESQRYPSLPISEDDVDGGLIEEHIHFIRRRKVCMLYMIENDGGDLWLYPREDLGQQNVKIPIAKKTLLLFRHDQMSFKYEPVGTSSVVLQTWILAEPPRLSLGAIFGDQYLKNEAYGIKKGLLYPEGERIRIMSLMTRLPGGSYGPMKYGTALFAGVDGMKMIPSARFDISAYYSESKDPGKSMTLHGGFCSEKEVFTFDNDFFGISDEEVLMMAPCQRVLLEVGYQCLSLSGYTKRSLNGLKCAVYVGDCGSDVWPGWNIDMEGMVKPLACEGMKNYVTSSRLSHVLGMTGPVTSIDTACSSSLVATNLAANDLRPLEAHDSRLLRLQNTNMKDALTVGISVIVSPYFYVTLSLAQMFSANGRCFTFDMSGDGYARGEGCGSLHLRNSTAQEDMDNQVAILMGANTNQDGKSATLTAPNGPSQQACIKASLAEAGFSASEMTIAECHGTGTALGDPIEVGALRRVLDEDTETPILVCSAKSNIGHLEAAAGMAGIEKCIMMLTASVSTPNCHLGRLNPHLEVNGFPALFGHEVTDTGLNSGLSGVSSFGFGGSNARGDVWAQCKVGPQATGELDFEKMDQVHVTCPITMGPIDWITGEPVSLRRSVEEGDQQKYKADVLRDEFAPYDVSAYIYSGGYRYRSKPLIEIDQQDSLDPGSSIYIRGSWSGYQYYQKMEPDGKGWYAHTMMLGEGRYEMFYLCVDQNPNLEIYPAINKASSKIWIFGPDAQRNGRSWIIDGRDTKVPAGVIFKIRFRWGAEVKSISWEDNPSWLNTLTIPFRHNYFVSGTWTSWRFQVMEFVGEEEDGFWSTTVRIGNTGTEQFQFARDRDWNQVIYPARREAEDTDIPVRGPDDMGHGKNWKLVGDPGEVYELQLRIIDAKVTVTVTAASGKRKVWESEEGWNRHKYYVAGLFNDWTFEQMIMDPAVPGVFKAQAFLPSLPNRGPHSYATWFRIVVDEDFSHSLYPELEDAGVGESIIQGPDGKGDGLNWMATSNFTPRAPFEISLDLTAEDRRKIVTWEFLKEE